MTVEEERCPAVLILTHTRHGIVAAFSSDLIRVGSTQAPDKREPLGAASRFEAQDQGQRQQAGRGSVEVTAKIYVGETGNYLKVSAFQIIRIIML